MYASYQIYDTTSCPWDWDVSKVGGTEHHHHQLQTSSASLCGNMSFQQHHQPEPHDHQIIDIPSKSSGDNFTKQDPPIATSQFSFTNALHSIVESFLSSSEESFSSSENYSALPSHNTSQKYTDFPHDHQVTLCHRSPQETKNDKKPFEISFQRNQADEQCSRRCGIACVPSSTNSVSKGCPTRKRRIKWTKDLHEPFIMIVNCLGGPEKAKPKTILEMMDSDVLTISHVKSHLQKYRSTLYMRKSSQGTNRCGETEGNRPEGVSELQLKIHKQIEESRQLQVEVQRSLHEQLEMQRDLQVLIEEQRKQLKIMLDQQKLIKKQT